MGTVVTRVTEREWSEHIMCPCQDMVMCDTDSLTHCLIYARKYSRNIEDSKWCRIKTKTTLLQDTDFQQEWDWCQKDEDLRRTGLLNAVVFTALKLQRKRARVLEWMGRWVRVTYNHIGTYGYQVIRSSGCRVHVPIVPITWSRDLWSHNCWEKTITFLQRLAPLKVAAYFT